MRPAKNGQCFEYSQLNVCQRLHEHGVNAVLALEHKGESLVEMHVAKKNCNKN